MPSGHGKERISALFVLVKFKGIATLTQQKNNIGSNPLAAKGEYGVNICQLYQFRKETNKTKQTTTSHPCRTSPIPKPETGRPASQTSPSSRHRLQRGSSLPPKKALSDGTQKYKVNVFSGISAKHGYLHGTIKRSGPFAGQI